MKLTLEEVAVAAKTIDLTGPVALGRQSPEDVTGSVVPFAVAAGESPRRVVVGWNTVPSLSQKQVLLTPLPDGRVRVENTGRFEFEVGIDGPAPLAVKPRGTADVRPPFTLHLPRCLARVEADDGTGYHKLSDQTVGLPKVSAVLANPPKPPADARQLQQIEGWLHQTLGVIQLTVGSADFENKAVETLVKLVGLQSGGLFRYHDGRWSDTPEAVYPPGLTGTLELPSQTVLGDLLANQRAVWQLANPRPDSSLYGREVVAAPLLGEKGEVVGVLYGQQPTAASPKAALPDRWKALLVDLLASGVSAGLMRREKEAAAAHAQARFDQFFSKPLARQLQDNPGMLNGRMETVTVLFCDIRGYSAASGKLGPARTTEWLRDVLGVLSQCVLDEHGVLVDYDGDGMMALWGAPARQDDQTARAVRAGLAMIRALPDLNREWQEELGTALDVGVGVSRGEALVGNVGSRQKFKYGAIGDVVNVASRTQGMTKHLKRRLLLTEAAKAHLKDDRYPTRRVVRAKLVNIVKPVNLFEVADAADDTAEFFRRSEAALDALDKGEFDRGEFARAGRLAGELLSERPGDVPLLLILSRAADALMRDGEGFSPVWTPPGK